MNKTLNIINQIYKPYRIVKKNNCFILYTMDQNICVKTNPKINYNDLYKYLTTRNFKNIPPIIESGRDNTVIYKYIEDIEVNRDQKANDLMRLLSNLHAKTAYFKEIKADKYKEIYETLKRRVNYMKNYYSKEFDRLISNEIYTPSEYLFLNNYTLIQNACNYSNSKIDDWWKSIENKEKQRICLIHNNLKLEHYIKNEKDYLISWDNYTYDSPILDLYNFYKEEWENIPFKELYIEYNKNFELTKDEKILLDILISVPYEIKKTNSEIDKCREYRRLIDYLTKSSQTVLTD